MIEFWKPLLPEHFISGKSLPEIVKGSIAWKEMVKDIDKLIRKMKHGKEK